ncbi:sulfotransferase [Pseudomaricurvus sp. HS19]|uniref:sulfotransferase family protein n=1 Tax=Pseudomaricurvus sp. HS19 TaxID=2692626 RepID=UPI001369042A|nr:sulfotransferase [Pseudomaricurvus sp. HS19]MYM63879.1 sulfotransferase [Pseudomaricurvus sp. HS19]
MSELLNANELLQAAKSSTGLSDWGDDSLPQRFDMAIDKLNAIAMDNVGRQATADVCQWLLTSRLKFFNDHKITPGLADEVIEQPLFATGEPRSGTTLLHALLSVDPDSRSLRFWEVMYPSPPPGLAAADDPRRAWADADWREINAMAPEWLKIHPYNDMLGDGLPECERTWAMDFRVMTPTAWWRAPIGMYVGGLPTEDHAQYRIHKMMLQHCQYGSESKKRWALKGFHGPRLKAFFDTYPDARLIWTHRDPVQVTASRIGMAIALTKAFAKGEVDMEQQAAIHLAATRAGIADTMNNPLIDDPRIFHVRYTDFVSDPVGTIRKFYEFCDIDMTDAAEQAMRDYLANNKGDRYGKFHYTTDWIKEDLNALNEEFAPYRQRFGLDVEVRK